MSEINDGMLEKHSNYLVSRINILLFFFMKNENNEKTKSDPISTIDRDIQDKIIRPCSIDI